MKILVYISIQLTSKSNLAGSVHSFVLITQVLESLVDLYLIFSSLLSSLILLVVQADQVFPSDVESIQVVNCILCTVNVFIYNEAGAFCFRYVTFSDLTDIAVLSEDIVELIRGNFVRQVTNENNAVNLRWKPRVSFNFGIHYV